MPSPTWPYVTSRMPGSRVRSRSPASATKAGRSPIGTVTSCLRLGPSLRCASETPSRSSHRAARCAGLPATTASRTRPRSTASASAASRVSSRSAAAAGAGELDEPVPRVGVPEGFAGSGQVLEHHVERLAGDQLVRGEALRRPLAQHREEPHSGVDVRQRDPGGRPARGRREQAQHRRGDDAEGALGADEQLLEVVAGVVLAHDPQAVPDPAVGQHHLEPEDEVAHHAVAQHRRAAGVRRDGAAHGAAALGAQRQREQPTRGLRRLLGGREDDAGLERHRVGDRVDVAHPAHPAQREHDLPAGRIGDCTAAEAGVAALGHHRDAGSGTQPHGIRDLRRARGAQHRRRPAVERPGPVGDVGRDVVGLGEDARRAERVEQGGQQPVR